MFNLQSSLMYLTYITVASAINLNVREVSFKATKDYIFETRSHPTIIYNPRYFEVVKKINLSPLTKSVTSIESLLDIFNKSCQDIDRKTLAQARQPRIIRIPGDALNVAEGVNLCSTLGNGYKLYELEKQEDVTALLSQTDGGRFTTPAAIHFDLRQHKFVFLSSNRPVTKKSAVYKFEDGTTIESYDYWDSYHDYFGRYLIENSQVYIDVAPSEVKYDHVYCIAPERFIDSKEDMLSCNQDLKFITDVSQTTIGRVRRLSSSLSEA